MLITGAQGQPASCPLQLLICSRVIQPSIPNLTKPYQILPNLTKPHQAIPNLTKLRSIRNQTISYQTKSNNCAPHRITAVLIPNHAKPYQTTIYHTNCPTVANLLAGHRGEWIMWGEIKPWTTHSAQSIFLSDTCLKSNFMEYTPMFSFNWGR